LHTRIGKKFDEKGVDLTIDVPDDLPKVNVDEDRIGQVLLNLAINSLHFTPKGGKVELHAEDKNGELFITMSDNGIGISADNLPHLFDRFYRVDKSRSRSGGGTGIGLTIAKYLVEAHGGRIWAASGGLGKGSAFTFTLPIYQR
jgi:signal transduction histidine kinase